MEFRQLEYFHMISKLENFTRTAELLHVSQPSVTKAIKNLEAELKITLIDRSQKHITLTPEGKAFFVHAEKILRAVDEALQDMSRFQKNAQGVVRLGIPPMIEAYVFPGIFTSFKQAYPKIDLEIVEYGYSSEVQAKLEEGALDLGIILDETRGAKNRLPIMRDQLSLCVYHAHPLSGETAVNFGQLRQETFILQHPEATIYQVVYARCVENDFTPDVLLNTAQLKTIKQLVANGSGISVLLDLVTRNETDFTVVPIVPPLPVNISLAWSQSKCLSQASQNFVEFIKGYIKSPQFKMLL